MTVSPVPKSSGSKFCGECGAKLESGIAFCGECGAAAPIAAPAATRVAAPVAVPVAAPPPARPVAPPTAPIARPCPNCAAPITPGKQFCRKCGMNLVTGDLPPLPTPKRPAPQPPPPPAPAAPASAAPKQKSPVLRGILGVVVPVATALGTYFLSNKLLGPFFVQQFGPSGQQVGSILCSTLVGGITRQIMR